MLIDYAAQKEEDFEKWWNDKGDETLRLDYPLDSNSVVVDAGGFEGKWAYSICEKYNSTVYVLEPIKEFFEKIKVKLSSFPKTVLLNYALTNRTCDAIMSVDGWGSTLFDPEAAVLENVKCLNIKEFLELYNISNIDLLKLNIEGSEYEVLEKLIELDFLPNIKNIQIQYHSYFPSSIERRNAITEKLSATHERTWNYEWIMENWKLNK